MSKLKKANGYLSIGVAIHCPNCGEYIDLLKDEDEGEFSRLITENQWCRDINREFECPECKKSFIINSLEY